MEIAYLDQYLIKFIMETNHIMILLDNHVWIILKAKRNFLFNLQLVENIALMSTFKEKGQMAYGEMMLKSKL